MKSYHSLEAAKVFENIGTQKTGLDQNEVKKRLEQYGKNVLEEKKVNKLKLFLDQFRSIFIYILLIASVISIVSLKWIDFFAIIASILINTLISFWQELKATISIQELKKLTESKETVIRNGEEEEIPSSNLVPGDIVKLSEGDKITADIRLFEVNSFFLDESSLTGESLPVSKDVSKLSEDTPIYEQKNMAFSGTHVIRGEAKGIVIATGKETYFASVAKKTEEDNKPSPLTRALNYFTKYYSISVSILLVIIGIVAYFQNRDLLEIAYILITELVSAVPEGLPIVITIVLVVGAKKLRDKKTLVRHLPATETLGSTTVIATDKTGTITEGKLIVEKVYSENHEEELKKIASLCNDQKDPIDKALKNWVPEFDQIRKDIKIEWEFPFDIEHRLMAVSDGEKLYVKGAFESLKEMTSQDLSDFTEKEKQMAEEGLRVLAFGIGDSTDKDIKNWKLKIIGLVGFLDPIKQEVNEAVAHAKKAHIRTILITGDSKETAKKIAEDAGIFQNGDKVLVGKDLDEMDDEQFYEDLKKTSVLARILPEHKYRLVRVLQEKNEIVSVTGDGVNDVPALRKADLGIAMGSGTEAAISISDMVLTDNNLNVIVEAIRLGRIIADNIRKVIYYLISSSLQEIFVISIAIILGFPLPLLPLHILWINIITDGVQDKFFAFAKEENNVMKRKPKKPVSQFFQITQIMRILYWGIGVGVLSLFMFNYLLSVYTYDVALTINFTTIVMLQWINGLQAQKEKEPFFKNLKKSIMINPLIFLGIGIGIVLQVSIIYLIPFVFDCVPLKLIHWIYPVSFCFIAFFLLELRKWVEHFYRKLFKKA